MAQKKLGIREIAALLSRGFVSAVLESQVPIAIFSHEEKTLRTGDFDRINDMRREFDPTK